MLGTLKNFDPTSPNDHNTKTRTNYLNKISFPNTQLLRWQTIRPCIIPRPQPPGPLHGEQPDAHTSSRHDREPSTVTTCARIPHSYSSIVATPRRRCSGVAAAARAARDKERRRAGRRQYGGRSSPERTSSRVRVYAASIELARAQLVIDSRFRHRHGLLELSGICQGHPVTETPDAFQVHADRDWVSPG